MRLRANTVILLLLTLSTAALGFFMAWHHKATWLEAISFVTGAICVWLTVKESVWNFPISLLNVSTFSVVYFNERLFADASLQVVYFVLTIIGWYLWLRGGEKHTPLRIVRTGLREAFGLAFTILVMTLVFWQTLRFIGGSASFFDAVTTALSLGAQWLLNRKRLENWILWIAADIVYIPLLFYKGLYLISLLYVVFLIMAAMGLFQWRATFRKQLQSSIPQPSIPEAVA